MVGLTVKECFYSRFSLGQPAMLREPYMTAYPEKRQHPHYRGQHGQPIIIPNITQGGETFIMIDFKKEVFWRQLLLAEKDHDDDDSGNAQCQRQAKQENDIY